MLLSPSAWAALAPLSSLRLAITLLNGQSFGWRVSREGWFIFPVHLLEEQGKTFTITLARARLAGRKPEDLI